MLDLIDALVSEWKKSLQQVQHLVENLNTEDGGCYRSTVMPMVTQSHVTLSHIAAMLGLHMHWAIQHILLLLYLPL